MSVLRRVEGDRAGPAALGVLLPPGRQTFLIVRPRGLSWDMLLLRSTDSTTFRDLTRSEGERAVGTFFTALEAWYAGGSGCVETVACADVGGFLVRAVLGPLPFLVCAREPGKPYCPLVFADAVEAEIAALRVATALRPPSGAEVEVYFNTRHFER